MGMDKKNNLPSVVKGDLEISVSGKESRPTVPIDPLVDLIRVLKEGEVLKERLKNERLALRQAHKRWKSEAKAIKESFKKDHRKLDDLEKGLDYMMKEGDKENVMKILDLIAKL
ncbi:MAG: hypothetical protein GXO19_04135 [Epsilonproteobacteria bacterium]|nr:hypothetical protein [Campylobacterota bacterium]NPA56911.1 hypothetical protein [Campylobacterota bacterium]